MVIRLKLQSDITYLRANQPTTATPLDMRDHPGLEKRGDKNISKHDSFHLNNILHTSKI